MQCSLYNDCFLRFRYGNSIHFMSILWKNCFLRKWNIGLKWIKHIPKENHHHKTCCFFYENLQEQMMWQKITMSSCNKTSKQVLSFLSNLTSALFILREPFLHTCLKFEASFQISRSSHPEVFCKNGVLRNVAKFTRKHLCQGLFFNKVTGGLQLY